MCCIRLEGSQSHQTVNPGCKHTRQEDHSMQLCTAVQNRLPPLPYLHVEMVVASRPDAWVVCTARQAGWFQGHQARSCAMNGVQPWPQLTHQRCVLEDLRQAAPCASPVRLDSACSQHLTTCTHMHVIADIHTHGCVCRQRHTHALQATSSSGRPLARMHLGM